MDFIIIYSGGNITYESTFTSSVVACYQGDVYKWPPPVCNFLKRKQSIYSVKRIQCLPVCIVNVVSLQQMFVLILLNNILFTKL